MKSREPAQQIQKPYEPGTEWEANPKKPALMSSRVGDGRLGIVIAKGSHPLDGYGKPPEYFRSVEVVVRAIFIC